MARQHWWQHTRAGIQPRSRQKVSVHSPPAEIARLELRQLLTAPAIANAVANQPTFDFAPIEPFATLTFTDPDTDAMFVRVTIDNGVNRGDFVPSSAGGWLRTVNGFDIAYTRSFATTSNIGAVVQTAVRALDFQPRVNAIPGSTRETTAFTVLVYDQTSAAIDAGTSVRVTSVNDPPVVSGGLANQSISDAETIAPFAAMTVLDADTQGANVQITVDSGTVRGDLTSGSTIGWNRTVNGTDMVYTRVFAPTSNIGDVVQTAIRSLVFRPRENAIPVGTSETTQLKVRVSDGLASMTNTTTTVVTTSQNNLPGLTGGQTSQPINSNQTINPFNIFTLTDPDVQDMFLTVSIENGTGRGDFTPASSAGWTRVVAGNEIRYTRYLPVGAAVGNRAITALRALVFQPRAGIPIGFQETTLIRLVANDGIRSLNTVTYIETTGV